ncbi:hypothetical protein CEXT_324401 [Caerostris extrusa]|uniref:Uncharacterized protein n=1 Tax=Caerostris extrusa TaxID=172846 RepID=A0AAV4USN4_CAEEX|nr:hypothetical protein CEXT_324401 [Caerostris extrusa]
MTWKKAAAAAIGWLPPLSSPQPPHFQKRGEIVTLTNDLGSISKKGRSTYFRGVLLEVSAEVNELFLELSLSSCLLANSVAVTSRAFCRE